MRYIDTVKIANITTDGYGDKNLQTSDIVPAIFVKRSGYTHANNMDFETSDAAVYLDHTNPIVLSKKDDLEGAYIQSEPFTDKNWYIVSSVNVAKRKLLNNDIDNIYCRLEKAAGPNVHIG